MKIAVVEDDKNYIKDYDFEKNGVDRSKVKECGVDESYKVKADFKFEVIKIERPKQKL